VFVNQVDAALVFPHAKTGALEETSRSRRSVKAATLVCSGTFVEFLKSRALRRLDNWTRIEFSRHDTQIRQKERWVRARSFSQVPHVEDKQGKAIESVRDDFFADAFRLSPSPIGITELDTGVCVEINDAGLTTFGFRRDEVIGKTTLMREIWPDPHDRARLVERLKSEGSVRNLEVAMRMKNGELRHFVVSTDLIPLGGKPYVLTIGHDMTDRKRHEEALRRTCEELEQRARERTADLGRANAALRDSEERFRLFTEHVPTAIAMFDRDMRYLAASRRWMEDYRLTGDLLGRSHYDVVPEMPVRWREIHRRALTGEILSADEDRFVRTDGSVQWLTWDVRPWSIGKEIGGIVVATEDVTERVRAKNVLHEREERSDQVIRLANFGIFDHDHRTGKVYWSPVMREIYGVGPDDPALLEGYIQLIHPDDREMVVMAMKRSSDPVGEDLYSVEHRLLRPDGSVRWVSFRSWTLFDNDGSARRPTRTLGAMVDITKRKRAEEALHRNQLELHQQQVQLEELTSKLLAAQEDERQRIARDLHDDVSQRLAALVLEVAALEQLSSAGPGDLARVLGPLREQLEHLSDDVHTLAYRLHPSLLEHAGLAPAIEDYVQQVSRRTGLPIHLTILDVPNAVPLDQATCLFRVMQESVQNVVKHAQATTVTVRLRGSTKGVGLSILDDGKGFDSRDLRTHQQGLGLSSMEERLRQVHGFFRIQSQPSRGTKVCAWVPCKVEVA
jgi:PAS domain S-box-containing protein